MIGVTRLMRTADLECELLQRQALLVGLRLGAGLGRAERAPQRQRLAEADVDVAVAPPQLAHDADEPAEALARLGGRRAARRRTSPTSWIWS